MPPKDKPKKLDAKELEAQRLLEEQQKKEEEMRLNQEEIRKYEVVTLSTGLSLILTPYCISQLWEHENPKSFLMEFITRYFEREGKGVSSSLLPSSKISPSFRQSSFQSGTINHQDLIVIVEFHIFNMIFGREKLHLDEESMVVFLNLMWTLMMNDNVKYEGGGRKSKDKDWIFFKDLLVRHSIESPPNNLKYFEPDQVNHILEYVKQSYFNHYDLFQYVDRNMQKTQEHSLTVYIDFPLEVRPLSQAQFLGTEKKVIKDDDDEIKKQVEEKLKIQEKREQDKIEAEKKRMEEFEAERQRTLNELDPQIMEIIKAKVKQTEQEVARMLEVRMQELDEKYENIAKQKKK